MGRTPKPLEEARANLDASISLIPDRYISGINRADWVGPAGSDAAEKNFGDAMAKVISSKSRATGVKRAGNESWRGGAIDKGAPVIAQRMRASLDLWTENFGKVYTAVLRVLPGLKPRTLDPMQNIDNRVKPVVKAAMDAGKRSR